MTPTQTPRPAAPGRLPSAACPPPWDATPTPGTRDAVAQETRIAVVLVVRSRVVTHGVVTHMTPETRSGVVTPETRATRGGERQVVAR